MNEFFGIFYSQGCLHRASCNVSITVLVSLPRHRLLQRFQLVISALVSYDSLYSLVGRANFGDSDLPCDLMSLS